MPGRKDIFQSFEYYHIFNRTIDGRKLFLTSELNALFLETLRYYRSNEAKLSFSHIKRLKLELYTDYMKKVLNPETFSVRIVSFCLMSNHYHLLLQQRKEKGVQTCMTNVVNSFTRFFNTRNKRKGPLFLPRFQSRHLISDEVLLHVSRYIHLNPYSSGLITNIEQLSDYQWSSYNNYLYDKENSLTETTELLKFMKRESYKSFVEDQADYQRSLEELKYMSKW